MKEIVVINSYLTRQYPIANNFLVEDTKLSEKSFPIDNQYSIKQIQRDQDTYESIIKMSAVKLQMIEEGSTPELLSQDSQETIASMLKQLYSQFPSLSPNRKHLARNYAQVLVDLLDKAPFLDPVAVQLVKGQLKVVQSIQQLGAVFIECMGFLQFLQLYGLQNQTLVELIYSNDKIAVDERVAMLESYLQFVWGIRHPTEFISFTDENKYSKLSRFAELAQNCSQLNYRQILQSTQKICLEILEKDPPSYMHTKHITQLWLNRIKGCLTESSLTAFFEEHIDDYPIREIIDRLKSSRKVKLHTFKAFLNFPEIRNYIIENLVKDNVMLKEILQDTRMDVKTKLTLIEKYPIFICTLEDPETLHNWRNRVGVGSKLIKL